jgi:hypothetical protein
VSKCHSSNTKFAFPKKARLKLRSKSFAFLLNCDSLEKKFQANQNNFWAAGAKGLKAYETLFYSKNFMTQIKNMIQQFLSKKI